MKKQMPGIKVYMIVLGALFLLMPFAGCGGEEPPSEYEPTARSGPKYGGTLRLTMPPDCKDFDPPLLSYAADMTVVHQCYESLVERNPDWTLRPLLAESWEPNDELTQWTFNLRRGVKFIHGKELKAEDVVYTFDRLFEVGSPLASVLRMVTDVIAVDDYTVRFDLSNPSAYLPDLISRYHAKICPSDIDPERLKTETFGTGPFTVTENVVGERTVMTKNPNYWWEGYPYLDELLFIYLPEPESRAEALKAGTVDFIVDLLVPNVAAIKAHPECRVSQVTSSSYMNLAMDMTVEPFNNKLVRQAIQAVTDREAINQAALFGKGGVAYDHPIAPTDPYFNEECKLPEYDPGLARELLEQAGYPDGINLTLFCSTLGAPMVEMAMVMKEKAAPAGIRIDIQVMPEDEYWSDVWMVKPFCTVYYGSRIPDEALSIVYLSGASWNECHYNNPRVDELIIKARSQVEPEDRRETYGEIQCILMDEVPRIIPVFVPVQHGMRLNVRGLEAKPHGGIFCRYAWLAD